MIYVIFLVLTTHAYHPAAAKLVLRSSLRPRHALRLAIPTRPGPDVRTLSFSCSAEEPEINPIFL